MNEREQIEGRLQEQAAKEADRHTTPARAKGSKLDAEAFGLVTGWEGKSNQHERDGAMVAWQYRMAGG